MSAAVSTLQHSGPGSRPASRVGTSSPVDNKRVNIKNEESSLHTVPSKLSQKQSIASTLSESTTAASPQISVDKPPERIQPTPKVSTAGGANHNEPLEKGSHLTEQTNGNGTPDYFSLPRPSRLDQEPNPFEQSFATNSHPGSTDPLATPKSLLPPVAAMTSPAPLGSGGFWPGQSSLRNGPLSPAMLQGPTNNSNSLSFDNPHLRTGLTPNESGIRSGLTPGGSGSMFPAPSPSNSLFFGGGATPGTMEFQKTALSAARKSHPNPPPPLMQPQLPHERKPENNPSQSTHDNQSTRSQSKPRQPSDPFGHDPATNAANGLFLLANQIPDGYQQAPQSQPISNQGGTMDSSPSLAKRAVVNHATSHSGHAPSRSMSGSSISNTVRGVSEISNDMSDSSQERETQSSRKRNSKSKGSGVSKRKNDDNLNKFSNKKSKAAKGQGSDDGMMDMDDDDDGMDDNGDGKPKDTKKMTDEEKRKNFLERNRVAALKCRQRKKQWLANLQAKVEMYGTENDALNATVQQLREEIVSLKTLLLAHKDCPVARANGVQLGIAALGPDYQMPVMTYDNMSMPAGVMQHHHQPGADQRRYS